MIGEGITKERPVTLHLVRAYLKKRKKEKELRYEQDLAYKYSSEFCKVAKGQKKKVLKELSKLPSIDRAFAAKIIDIWPQHEEVLKILPEKDSKVTAEDLHKAFEIVQASGKK